MQGSDTDLNADFLFENLMKGMTDALYFKDLESRFITMNEACLRKHGWNSIEQVVGKTDFDVFSDEHAEQAYFDEQKIIRTGEPLTGIDEKETWPDGRVTWVSSTKMPLRNSEGEIIGTFGISRDVTERKLAELKAQEYAEQIRAIKEEMEEDLHMAAELQKSFFPSTYPQFPEGADDDARCVEFLHLFRSSREVSGDYWNITRLSDSEACIFLCDTADVGVRAALASALIRGIRQEIISLARRPGEFLERMNELLISLLGSPENRLDISVCYLVLDVASGRVRLASAGHPSPLHFQDGRTVKPLFENHALEGPALGTGSGFTYPEIECQLQPGDSVVLYTKGLVSVQNEVNDAFGPKRLMGSAHSLVGDPLTDIFDGLEGDALAFAKDNAFSDDVCMVGFELRRLLS
jgi:sigma-B regulation protein RsbU (phosphoserine phosphatase)